MQEASDSYMQSWQCHYSHHWPRRGTSQKVSETRTWWRSGIRSVKRL